MSIFSKMYLMTVVAVALLGGHVKAAEGGRHAVSLSSFVFQRPISSPMSL
jgi:hypothetical protein